MIRLVRSRLGCPGSTARWCAGVLLFLALCRAGHGHRLDEYLQATRLDLHLDRVGIEMDLTPGIDVAARVIPWIDVNGDGTVSATEVEAYTDLVLHGMRFEVDGRPRPVKLLETQMAGMDALKSGAGAIRLQAEVFFDRLRGGEHRFFFQTQHLTNLSVYLVNALVPSSPHLKILKQDRDVRQTQIRLDIKVE